MSSSSKHPRPLHTLSRAEISALRLASAFLLGEVAAGRSWLDEHELKALKSGNGKLDADLKEMAA